MRKCGRGDQAVQNAPREPNGDKRFDGALDPETLCVITLW
jgi:hypothetical protein